ncbi:MAG: CHAT domain-containing tetratricopeptide repeat protein [Bacteroidia bacterium]|nr:CHAT domain-containing tetratricopeptide repeat protein [Bacteroidia bacterium]
MAQSSQQAEDLAHAQKWMDEAYIYFQQNPDTAIYYLLKALPLFEKHSEWESYSSCMNGLVACYMGKEDYLLAENYGQETLLFIRKHLGKKVEVYADALNNMGTLYRLQGNLNLALENYEEALSITENQDSLAPLAISRLYYNMGIIYRRRGEPDRAIKFHEKALANGSQELPSNDPRLIQILFAMARVYTDQKAWNEALHTNLRCLQLLESGNPEKTFREKINVHHQLAQIYLDQQKTDSAAFYIDQADRIHARFGHYREQVGENIRGEIDRIKHNYPRALVHYRKALQMRLEEWGSLGTNPDIANSFKTIGSLFEETGKYDSAIVNYYQALQFLCKPYKGKLPAAADILHPFDVIPVLESIARTSMAGNPKSYAKTAIQACLLADTTIARLRHTYQEDNAKLQLGQKFRNTYETGIKLFFQQFQETHNTAFLEKAFLFSEKSRSMALTDALQSTGAKLSVGIPDSISRKEQQILINRTFYQEKLFQETLKGDQADTVKIKKWKEALFNAEEAYHRFIRYLESAFPAYFQLKYDPSSLSIAEVQKQFPDKNTTLLEYFWGEKNIYIFLLTTQGISGHSLSKTDDMTQAVDGLRYFLHKPDYSPEVLQKFVRNSNILYKGLISPILGNRDSGKLLIIPDGPLSYIPFEILLSKAIQSDSLLKSSDFRSMPYLIRKFEIGYGLSARLFFHELPPSTKPRKLLGAFSPIYPDSLLLTYSRENAIDITATQKGTLFLDHDATKSTFKTQAGHFRILHLAMHGFSNEKEPLLAHLLFSGEPDSSTQLYAFELYNMLIPADLVVLAACETGDGKLIPGEGIMSLARAFRYAGSAAMVSSLWKADGRSTSDILQSFYHDLFEGHSKTAALRQARLRFLDQCTPDLVHPYYWANHILIGNPAPLNTEIPGWVYIGILALISTVLIFIFFLRKKMKNPMIRA